MKITKIGVTLALIAMALGAFRETSMGYPQFLAGARKFGAKDCTFCHVKPEGGEPFGPRAKWLIAEKERRGANIVDPEWLADYKPGQKTADKSSDKNSKLEQEILKLEVEWTEAARNHDKTAIARLLADDFASVDETGLVLNKTQFLAAVPDVTIESYSYDEVSVRGYGSVAVATARWVLKGSFKGSDFSGEYRETDVWVKSGSSWQVVASHITKVVKK
ncbi:MAG TPA: nuclear transport factor 2 family protein [Blastocatellia bacterium]|nr:nuclear transport factor 2 family protein [Blastocatellia bacterium]